ncbi:MAG: extracellular solute-binding protein, partial [Cyanobacteria bacterium J06648_11]
MSVSFGHSVSDRSLSRRQVLRGLGAIAASYGLAGCGDGAPAQLNVTLLPDMLPGSIWRDLRRMQFEARPVQVSDRAALFDQLIELAEPTAASGFGAWIGGVLQQIFPAAPAPVRLNLLGADWLDRAIARNAIAPWSSESLGDRFTDTIPERWRQAVQRDGQIWGVPWTWGVTAIAYNRKFVETEISDWSDLWRSEFKGKLVLPDSPREVIGLTQKSLGRSYNDPIDDVELRQTLGQLHEQVLLYTSEHYLQTSIVEDSWV